MRATDRTGFLQRWLEARWYGGSRVPAWLSGLSQVFAWIARRRRVQGQRQARRLPVPVIVVGNITVGGTGKTPVVIALVEALRAAGYSPGVISRGYGGRSHEAREVGVADDPAMAGDEPLLIARRGAVPVVVGRDRVAAATMLLERHRVDVIVSDDGLQHHRLARDVEIVVVDGRRRFGNGRLLPAGPMREPATRLAKVDVVLVNGTREPGEAGFDLVPGDAWSLAGDAGRALSSFAGQPVDAVAAIGDPSRFFAALRAAGVEVAAEHAFPDHHAYQPADLEFGTGRPLLMTEKDAVKCVRFARDSWFAVPVTASLGPAVIERIRARLPPPQAPRPQP